MSGSRPWYYLLIVKEKEPAMPIQLVDSSELLGSGDALRTRAAEDGYLFFRKLIPAEDILAVRADVLTVVEQHGWLQPGQDELGGVLRSEAFAAIPESEMRTDIGVTRAMYDDVQKLESMHRLPHHPKLLAFFERLFDKQVLVHARHIARMITSHPAMVPTPAHQDFPLIQGTSGTWTAWFPLGDCPRGMGGLTVLRASHTLGYVPIQPAQGAGGLAVQLCPADPPDWAEIDYQTGDVLAFPCFTVHRALPATIKDQIRLSLDVRYQPIDEVIEARSLKPHCLLTWEEIYAGWQRDDLKYYWQHLPLNFQGWDDSLLQPKSRIC
jgi:ectoine hydroxylase-related dioxygenase (phytanoyl-CoA dioxygenase family)